MPPPSLPDALRILDALAHGVQPLTGEALDGPDWLLDPRVQAALQLVHTHAGGAPGTSSSKTKPARQGKGWSDREEADLVAAFDAGVPVVQIAAHHERSSGAIHSRLTRLGLIERKGEKGDRGFLRAFETAALLPRAWDHRAHLRVAYTLLLDHSVTATTDKLRVGLRAILQHFGIEQTPEQGYHETLTVAWVRVVAGRMQSIGRGEHFHDFIAQHPDLLDTRYLRRHYTRARAMSADARQFFLPADIEPLPPVR